MSGPAKRGQETLSGSEADPLPHSFLGGLRRSFAAGLYQQKVMRLHQAFDPDFRAVPSEGPALPFEGTLH